ENSENDYFDYPQNHQKSHPQLRSALPQPMGYVLKVLRVPQVSLFGILEREASGDRTRSRSPPDRWVDPVGDPRPPPIIRFLDYGDQVVELGQKVEPALDVLAVRQFRPARLMHIAGRKAVIEGAPTDVGEDRLGGDNVDGIRCGVEPPRVRL